MLRLRPGNNITVPDKFSWRFPQDGFVAQAFDRDAWFATIDKHYKDNQYEQPENWREIAEDALCRRLSGEWCIGGGPESFFNARFTIDDFFRGAKVVLTGKIVSQDVAEERARLCSMCPANVPVQGCGACTGVANLVATLKGAKSTKYDYLLKACGICFCPNESQVWYAAEDLAKGVTPEMMQTYRTFPDCWKWKSIDALGNQP